MRAPSKCSLCTAQKLGTYSAVQCVSTDRIDKRWVVQVVLIASNVCGCVTVWELFEARLIFFSSSECSLAGLIQGQEKIEEIQYLKNYATYKNVTCTITFVRTCTFQWYQYCSYNVLLGVSTAKNYCPVIEGVTHSTFQLHPSAPKAGMVTNIRCAAVGSCCSLMLQKSRRKILQRRNRKRPPKIHDS